MILEQSREPRMREPVKEHVKPRMALTVNGDPVAIAQQASESQTGMMLIDGSAVPIPDLPGVDADAMTDGSV